MADWRHGSPYEWRAGTPKPAGSNIFPDRKTPLTWLGGQHNAGVDAYGFEPPWERIGPCRSIEDSPPIVEFLRIGEDPSLLLSSPPNRSSHASSSCPDLRSAPPSSLGREPPCEGRTRRRWVLQLGSGTFARCRMERIADCRERGAAHRPPPDHRSRHEESRYWGDIETGLHAIDIWIGEENNLGRGLGTCMMRLGLAKCFAGPEVKAALLDPLAANTRAHRFYERLGFKLLGPRRFGQDDCLGATIPERR